MNSFNASELLLGLLILLVTGWSVYDILRRRAKDRAAHRALFQRWWQKQQQRPTPPDLSLLLLTERQLAGWRELLSELEAGRGPIEQQHYCRRQIARLEQELAWLRKSGQ